VAGTLYIVATPIGNLEDITLRALRILREASLVACEDTRQSRKLLDRFGVAKPLLSYHEHNEAEAAAGLIAKLEAGETVALISDAGTPLVSDPGYRIVAAARRKGIAVVPVPGPSALLAALSAAGLPTDSFRFGGFLPGRSGQRRTTLERLKDETATLVFYEAPHRILETLGDIAAVLGERRVVLARELTKVHEEFLEGSPRSIREELARRPAVKGEITLLIERGAARDTDEIPLAEAVEERMAGGGSRMDAIKAVARERGLPKRDVYRAVEERE
jgi:16S rRNA (cytidine1402-2'-O)-methyltransferase